ncbi:ABC transporter permease subunit, partial [Pseudomonas aeruginosa]|nr:ABC transporter permease subunit [Pseudomonas aeruginosa]
MALDIFVVLIYAAGMIALGWYGMRRAKTRDDYLVAGRNLGPGFYLGTMAATVLGGASTIGTVRLGYVHGISGFWLCGAIGLGIVGLSLFLAKPLLKLKIYTVTQVLERRYNPAARHASALIMLVYALMIGATSTIAIGTVMQVLFGLPFWVSILIGGGVVVLYSTIGGMWSLTLTDIVQFLIMTVGLVFLLMPLSINDAGGWDALVAKLPASYFDFTAIGWDTIVTYFLIYFFGIFIGQDIWQRVFTARSETVAKVAGSAAGIYCVLYGMAGALIGMAAKVLLPDLENVNNAFASVVEHSLPNGIRGLVIAAALAALIIRIALCYFSEYQKKVINRIIIGFVSLMRAIPFLILAYLLYYGLPQLGISMEPWTAGLLALIIYHGAYFFEILRSQRRVFSGGYIEAAIAQGFS